MKVLNGYAGLGGNRRKWPDDVEVTAVEMEPEIAAVYMDQHPNDTMVIGDAHQYLLDHYQEFDFIWTSPPCPTHSAMAKATRHEFKSYPDMRLYQEVLFLQHFFKGNWVVENVKSYYTPLIAPQEVSRHYFWSNFHIPKIDIDKPKNFIDSAKQQDLKDWLGIQYEGNIYYKGNHCPNQVLRNCVHPDLGSHVLQSSIHKSPTTVSQVSLF